MNSFANVFQPNFRECDQTPGQFGDYRLQFLYEHQKSYKQLGDVLFIRNQDRSQQESPVITLPETEQVEEYFFDLEVQIKLRKYTSFQNGFMENHRQVLKNSLQQFQSKVLSFASPAQDSDFQLQITSDIKSIVFNQRLFTNDQIEENKDRLLSKVDQYKILREILQSFNKFKIGVKKDAMMMGVWILKHTDHLVSRIVHQNSFYVVQVQKVKEQLLVYLQKSKNIDILKPKIAEQSSCERQFDLMIESWLYTLLIAKLGYFDNDCFDFNLSLQQHLKVFLKKEKRQHSVLSDSQEESVMSIQIPNKKTKLSNLF